MFDQHSPDNDVTPAPTGRLWAVLPAAGHSRRMGKPKLLLPLGGKTVVEHLLDSLHKLPLSGTIVVVRPDDLELQQLISQTSATCVQPIDPPPDMRASVQYALNWIKSQYAPQPHDSWMLIPADHPVLDAALVLSLLEAWHQTSAEILIPTFGNRRGHPTFFRWSLLGQLLQLPGNVGLNSLVKQSESNTQEVPVDDPAILIDLDTPADYARLLKGWENR